MDFASLIPRASLVLEVSGFTRSTQLDLLAREKKLARVTVTPQTLEGITLQADVVFASLVEVPDQLSEKLVMGGLLILCLSGTEREDIKVNAELFLHRASSEVSDQTVSVYSRR